MEAPSAGPSRLGPWELAVRSHQSSAHADPATTTTMMAMVAPRPPLRQAAPASPPSMDVATSSPPSLLPRPHTRTPHPPSHTTTADAAAPVRRPRRCRASLRHRYFWPALLVAAAHLLRGVESAALAPPHTALSPSPPYSNLDVLPRGSIGTLAPIDPSNAREVARVASEDDEGEMRERHIRREHDADARHSTSYQRSAPMAHAWIEAVGPDGAHPPRHLGWDPPCHDSTDPSARQYALLRRDPTTTSPHAAPLRRRANSSAAYSSGIIADWTHQSRSVWFQRKAIIIISCFLAIFIVLIIGAAVFLRDHRDDIDGDDGDDDDLSDEAALRRMREERRMRSGSKAKGKKDNLLGDDAPDSPAGREKSEAADRGGRLAYFRRRKKGTADREESSLGSSTAISKKIVSRWIRSSRTSSADHSSSSVDRSRQDRTSSPEDAASLRSQHSAASRRSRLGAPRSNQVEVVYSGGETTAPVPSDSSTRSAHAADPLASGSSAGDSAGSRSRIAAPSAVLDGTDIQAAEAAEHDHHEANLPPAYIPDSSQARNRPESRPPSPSSLPMRSGSTQPTYQRPLAGEFASDIKSVGTSSASQNTSIPPHVLAALEQSGGISRNGLPDGRNASSAHLATDDKARLAALAAAASAPAVDHPAAPSAPVYHENDDSGTSLPRPPSSAEPAAPSAPALFEDDADGDLHQSSLGGTCARPPYQGEPHFDARPSATPDFKGKGKGALPAPPVPHTQDYSPFDQPYRDSWLSPSRSRATSRPATASSLPVGSSEETVSSPPISNADGAAETATVPAGSQSESASRPKTDKQREAEAELALMASSPAEFAARTRDGHPASSAEESLPAYERDGRPSGPPSADTATSAATATATAPAIDTIAESLSSALPPTQMSDTDSPGPSQPAIPLHGDGEEAQASAPALDAGD